MTVTKNEACLYEKNLHFCFSLLHTDGATTFITV
eukprot:CAMPEP_0203729026 /NCGR_PEP_ID=MMETSP0092-20131115/15581_1 /ASSEMBLY_ACC=CAM_ASM_001090 /TAXON_ID=426623 /ORGANISM="Chaetoceros affinis, Strain CCMP159" /LENGTH=33 /DNA_ID= /DNA_START= /DNA_END= /DNA_ORIENTATION=